MAQTEIKGGAANVSLTQRPIVEVHYAGYRIGLYRVRDVGRRGMLLGHGGISFPVGTELVIEDFQKLAAGPGKRLPARVVRNDLQGIAVSW
ncbi:MAG: hypothetical protein HXY26_07375 [Hydrogenophilaceae bacterium]|nr:hypothetical protein [Hydrogenophilaceae bacterium]